MHIKSLRKMKVKFPSHVIKIIVSTSCLTVVPLQGLCWSYLLGWPQSLFGFFHNILQKKPKWTFWPTQYNPIIRTMLRGDTSMIEGIQIRQSPHLHSFNQQRFTEVPLIWPTSQVKKADSTLHHIRANTLTEYREMQYGAVTCAL